MKSKMEILSDEELIKYISEIAYKRWQSGKDEECVRIFKNIWHTIQYD